MIAEKDYIMRMIRQFGTALARIRSLKTEQKIEESQNVLAEALKDFTGFHQEVLEALPPDILIQKVSGSGQTDPVRSLLLADLLYQQGDIYELQGEMSKTRNVYIKSLHITLHVLLNGDNLLLEENREKVSCLLEKVRLFRIPKDTKLLLFPFYEFVKNYGKAEDVLLELIDESGTAQELLTQGIAFYERLQSVDAMELEEGNLPLDEVLEGLANLRGYLKG